MKAPSRLTQRWFFSATVGMWVGVCVRGPAPVQDQPPFVFSPPLPPSLGFLVPTPKPAPSLSGDARSGLQYPLPESSHCRLSHLTILQPPQPRASVHTQSSPPPQTRMNTRSAAGAFATPAANPAASPGGAHSPSAPAHLALKRLSPAAASSMPMPMPPQSPPREGDPCADLNCWRASVTSRPATATLSAPRDTRHLCCGQRQLRQEAEAGGGCFRPGGWVVFWLAPVG